MNNQQRLYMIAIRLERWARNRDKCNEHHGRRRRPLDSELLRDAAALLRRQAAQCFEGGHGRTDNAGKLSGPHDLSTEDWRAYTWGPSTGRATYKIYSPQRLYFRKGGSTHRVVDNKGVTHCIPAPGHMGCVLRWYAPEKEVSF